MSLWLTQRGRWFGVPFTRVTDGSVVRRTLLGLTPTHADARASRWIAKHRGVTGD